MRRIDSIRYHKSALRAPKRKKERTTNRTFGGKQNTMYVQRVKIPLHRSAPVQREKVVRYCEISCGVPEYRQPQPETIREPEVASVRCDIPTRDGSLSREMITGVVMVGMVANAFLCDRGRSLNVLPEIEPHPTRFRVNSLNQRDKGSGSITLNGKTKAMHYEMSDEPIVAMKVKPVKYRTCIAGCRGRLYEDKT
jgi:hypothetical protein